MAHVAQTRQRGRWWPLSAFERPAPIPTTSGPVPARGFTMFSAVKFVVAGVIVALFGGFLLVAQPFEQQGASVPGLATDAASSDPVLVTGRTKPECPLFSTVFETDDGRTEREGGGCGLILSSDPRLGGELTTVGNPRYLDGEEIQVYSATLLILNEGGRWYGTATGGHLLGGDIQYGIWATSGYWTAVLTGADSYEGLTAFLSGEGRDGSYPGEYRGVIFRGQMPAQPEHFCDITTDPARLASLEDVHPWVDRITTSACQETPSAPAVYPGDFDDYPRPDPPG